jgi:hypothetical protein
MMVTVELLSRFSAMKNRAIRKLRTPASLPLNKRNASGTFRALDSSVYVRNRGSCDNERHNGPVKRKTSFKPGVGQTPEPA